ncbi:citrate synthase [Desulfoferrobacter suflitae]|uniref:citrate synthase n=1 Tax=Desulfoferrobacter suflitae TaxID=2865782 RepID=UPI002164E22C|nr:citrate synthase [Desulfoferrobacter suflitae]MCK8600877.1 citrate synthase [Desulfoferrobacter suflitae]
MAEEVRIKNTGLRGVAVADTKISFIDGEKGILLYRGFRIEDLAQKSSFVETAYLLLNGSLPDEKQLAEFSAELVKARRLPDFINESYKRWPAQADPMDVLQASVPLLAMADEELEDESREANVRKAIRLIARIPALVAAWHRIRNGLEPVAPDDKLSHAENFLWQLLGHKPAPEFARELDICLLLHADHTFNASTFACREVVSTRAHMYAGVAAGVGALSGSLHGGANARVVKMIQDIAGERDLAGWIRNRIDQGERIMGMGHAVYKTTDPRAVILKQTSEKLGKKAGNESWFKLLTQIEALAVKEFEARGKPTIKPNVDFYSGSVYHMLNIPNDLMTPMFAIARITGWCSHIIEEKFAEAQGKPALYRPKAEYVGDYCGPVGCEYRPPEARK